MISGSGVVLQAASVAARAMAVIDMKRVINISYSAKRLLCLIAGKCENNMTLFSHIQCNCGKRMKEGQNEALFEINTAKKAVINLMVNNILQ